MAAVQTNDEVASGEFPKQSLLDEAIANGPWKPRDDMVFYTMKDARRVNRKRALFVLEWKLRKYTWRQRRFVRNQWKKRVGTPINFATYFAEGAARELKRELRR